MPESTPEIEPAVASAAAIAPAIAGQPPSGPTNGIDGELAALPSFARQLLQIRVPVQVTLASQRKSVQEIVELGPGSIVKFTKTCDEPLDLCIHDRTVARGDVVKVGDKFGLRITSLVK